MTDRDRFTDAEWKALVKALSAAFGAVVATDHPGLLSLFRESYVGGKAIRVARKRGDWPPVVAEMIEYQKRHQSDLNRDTSTGVGACRRPEMTASRW